MCNGATKVLRGLLHLEKNHGRDFLGDCTRGLAPKLGVPAAFSTHEFFLLATVLDTHVRLSGLVESLEGEVL